MPSRLTPSQLAEPVTGSPDCVGSNPPIESGVARSGPAFSGPAIGTTVAFLCYRSEVASRSIRADLSTCEGDSCHSRRLQAGLKP